MSPKGAVKDLQELPKLIALAEEAEARAGIAPVPASGPQPSAQVAVSPQVKVTKADKIFLAEYGHSRSECLAGCYRPKGRGDARVDVHRKSMLRPAPNTGKPFTETYAEKLARRAAKRNGPVTTVPAPAPAATPTPVAKRKATPPTPVPAGVTARMDAQDSRLLVMEVSMGKILAILERAQVKANGES